MKFKLGVVGHKDTLKTVAALVDEYFDEVEVHTEEFGNDEIIADAIRRIELLQEKCDGILYSRKDPYLLISEHLHHSIPVSYVEIDKSHLLISLLKAIVYYGSKPNNISIDGLDRGAVIEAFQTAGIPEKELTIHMVKTDAKQPNLVNTTLNQHLQNWANGAQLCITNITDVCRSLHDKKIAATVINPTVKSFVNEIRNLTLRYKLKNETFNHLAILHIKLQYKEKYRFYTKMPIREVDELGEAAKLIAIFAERLDGAMFSLNRWEYLIVCSGSVLQNATNQFIDISLMQNINATTAFDVTIGIGYGQTVKEAERNAVIACNHTLTHRGTNTFVALASHRLIGPLRPKGEHFIAESATDAKLNEIASNTGISTNTLTKLFQATLRHDSSLFTSAQLSDALEVSTRTVNRIIQRLLDNRYAVIEGKNLNQTRGRPARIIRLLF